MGFGAIRSILRPLSRTLVSRVAASCSSAPLIPAAKPELCSFLGGSRLPWIPMANHFHSLSLTDTRLPKRRPMAHPKKKRFKLKPPGPYAYVQYTPGEPIASNNPNKGSVKRRNAKKRIGQRRAFILSEKKKRQGLVQEAKRKKRIKEVERKMAKVARERAWEERLAELQRLEEEKKKSIIMTTSLVREKKIKTNGIWLNVAEKGDEGRPLVLLLHGFPETWFSWRHQIDYLSSHGYHVVAPDLRGYGDSEFLPSHESYTVSHLVADVIGWSLCLFRPDRVKGFISLSVPYSPRDPNLKPSEFSKTFGDGLYITQFQKPGRAEAAFAKHDCKTVMKKFLLTTRTDFMVAPPGTEIIDDLVIPSEIPEWITEEEIQVYADKFQKSGFTGPLNYYRAMDLNWEILAPWEGSKILVPTKFIAGGRDIGAKETMEYVKGEMFKSIVPNVEVVVIEDGHHFIQQEKAKHVSEEILSFFNKLRTTEFEIEAFGVWARKMDPDAVKSTLSNLAFGNVLAAAARDYKKEVLANEKAQSSNPVNEEVDLDELMDDPELEKLHADRIAALKREVEKREAFKRQGHGEYREVSEGDFLGEVTRSQKVICHFYHKEFYRCKIMDKHLKSLAPRHVDTKFIRVDAENAPFFVTKLAIKTLPCVLLFSKGVAIDRLVGFQDLGTKDDFTTTKLENVLIKKGMLSKKKKEEDDEDAEYQESVRRSVRSSENLDSDSD
ncbi:BnaC07g32000D [Brassica napus]|uniref:Thioredoxin domain-containing protein n=2 Tax=Brassica TaxID=3705 RepID=A0A3P6F265_BRAOL|nr:unnamed protein product [Brassica napus]CDY28994.1 BnaC07g32000D [Brassica napus]VDD39565.1 unnamed protein product [Brassica oleracea]